MRDLNEPLEEPYMHIFEAVELTDLGIFPDRSRSSKLAKAFEFFISHKHERNIETSNRKGNVVS